MASLVVLNWQAEEATARCVDSLQRLDGYEDCELIVVDNESTPASRRALCQLEGAKVVPLQANLGYAGGMNAGIFCAQADVVAIFNNDLVVDRSWLREGLRVLQDPAVGIVGGAEFSWDGASELRPGAEILGMSRVDPERGFAVLGPMAHQERAVAGVDGNNLLARSDLLRRLGGFDESYFAYYEDVDLCARAWALGYETVFCPSMLVWHRRGSSSDRVPTKRAFWAARNHLLTVAKHFPEPSWPRTVVAVALEDLADALLGHTGGLRSRGAERLSLAQRAGRVAAVAWAVLHARDLAAKRAQTIASGQHDESYTAHLRQLAEDAAYVRSWAK